MESLSQHIEEFSAADDSNVDSASGDSDDCVSDVLVPVACAQQSILGTS